MTVRSSDVIATGHICVDIIPRLNASQSRADELFTPGNLTRVGPAKFALGGSVANTGLALHRLGANVRLIGKLGDDPLGELVRRSLHQINPPIADNMILSCGEPTSYTIVISPPNVDRGFLHCSGTNDTFTAEDLQDVPFHDSRILHFGYPPLMRGIFADEGIGLAKKFNEVQAAGALVSLDMAMPSPDTTNWRRWFRNVLPYVDVFLPSLDEILILLDPLRNTTHRWADQYPAINPMEIATTLSEVSEDLHGLGVPIVLIKLGGEGLYLSTNEHVSKLKERSAWDSVDWTFWEGRKLLAPCYDVNVVGTTGSGDCTVAGFLWALLHDVGPEQSLRWATAVGAHCVEAADSISGIPSWSKIRSRMRSSWQQRPLSINLPSWQFCPKRGVYVAPEDGASRRLS